MKFKIMIMALLLMSVGIGSAADVNRLPATEFVGKITAGAGIDMYETDLENWAGSSRAEMTEWDAYIRESGGEYTAYLANGSVVGSPSGDIGVVANGLIDVLRAGTYNCYKSILIDIDGTAYIATPIILYNGTKLSGLPATNTPTVPRTRIESGADITFIQTNSSHTTSHVHISDLEMRSNRSGTDYHTTYLVHLYRTRYSTVERIFTVLECGYSASNRGGLIFNGTGESTNWLNVVQNCHLNYIEIVSTHDMWIKQNVFVSWGRNRANFVLRTSNNVKIKENHFVVPTTGAESYGFLVEAGSFSYLWFTGNFIEPQEGTSGGDEYAWTTYGHMYYSSVSENTIVNMGRMGFNFHGGASYSDISGNIFLNINSGNDANARCISFGAGSYNTIHHNIARNTVSTTKAPFCYGTSYTSYVGNVVHGKFSDDITNVGTGSVETGTISTLT